MHSIQLHGIDTVIPSSYLHIHKQLLINGWRKRQSNVSLREFMEYRVRSRKGRWQLLIRFAASPRISCSDLLTRP